MAELDIDLDLIGNLEAERLLLNSSYSNEESNLTTSKQLKQILNRQASASHQPTISHQSTISHHQPINQSANQQPQQPVNNFAPTPQPNHHKDVLPSRVGNYILKKKIGSGNFAVVKLGEHAPTKAKVSSDHLKIDSIWAPISTRWLDDQAVTSS